MPHRFERDAIPWFHRLLGLALIACVAEDISCGAWFVHSGRYFPWRHPGFLPLYPAPFLGVEWSLLLFAGLSYLLGRRSRWVAFLAASTMLISLLQRFSNHRSLIFIVLLYLALAPRERSAAAYRMIRYQLLIVYLFSAMNKIDSGFLSGKTLFALGLQVHGALLPDRWVHRILTGSLAEPLSWLTVGAELVIPVLLMQWPGAGLVATFVLHFGFSVMMPTLWPFTLIMMAMAVLFSSAACAPTPGRFRT